MEKVLEKVKSFVYQNRENILRDLCELCAIDSVSKKDQDGLPFGKGVDDALVKAIDIAKAHGVCGEVKHELGYALSNAGNGEKCIGFFSHCDVVPAKSEEWIKTEPFTPMFDGNFLYCRGSEDNKAAAIGGIYISEMVNNGILPIESSFMCYFGGNEECGMSDLKAFIKNEKIPDLSLVPDHSYPVCVGEKGIARFEAVSGKAFKTVSKFDGGNVVNAVIGTLEAKIEYTKELFDELSQKAEGERIKVSEIDGKIDLVAYGRSTHAANPGKGENAAVMAAELLCSCESFCKEDKEILLSLLNICKDHFGSGVGIDSDDKDFGKNTFVLGIVKCEENILKAWFDSRFGRGFSTAEIIGNIKKTVEGAGFSFDVNEIKDCFVSSTEEKFVEALMCTYAKMCCVERESVLPYYSGGGTYGRYLPTSLGFSIHNFAGVDCPESDLPQGHGNAHEADERILLEAYLHGIVTDAMIIYELDKSM